jgi:BMFP domain-containing protein YqiC
MTKVISSAKRIWNELDYAQRRSFELKTGVPLVKREQRETIAEREAQHELDAAERC